MLRCVVLSHRLLMMSFDWIRLETVLVLCFDLYDFIERYWCPWCTCKDAYEWDKCFWWTFHSVCSSTTLYEPELQPELIIYFSWNDQMMSGIVHCTKNYNFDKFSLFYAIWRPFMWTSSSLLFTHCLENVCMLRSCCVYSNKLIVHYVLIWDSRAKIDYSPTVSRATSPLASVHGQNS